MTDALFYTGDYLTPAPAEGVLACQDWHNNGELIADLARLGYLRAEHSVVDVTYGKGTWWNTWRPLDLIAHDLDQTKGDGVDFRQLPHPPASFDVVAYDPPYINSTPADVSTTPSFGDAYGLAAETRNSFEELWALLAGGLAEAARVVRPGGLVLAKAMAYTNGRIFRHVPALLIAYGEALGLDLVDELLLRRTPGPLSIDPSSVTRSRRNVSTLLIFRRRSTGPRTGPTAFATIAQGPRP